MGNNVTIGIKRCVNDTIGSILHSRNDAWASATLAQLRRGLGKKPGDVPELWDILFSKMPDECKDYKEWRGDPSKAEWAIYIALTLFAMHQQGNDRKQKMMHVPREKNCRESLGTTLRKLANASGEGGQERIRTKLNALAKAPNITSAERHLRNIVYLLRDKGIPMDYGDLAVDLFLYQSPQTASGVKLRWAEDFYRTTKNNNDNSNSKSN